MSATTKTMTPRTRKKLKSMEIVIFPGKLPKGLSSAPAAGLSTLGATGHSTLRVDSVTRFTPIPFIARRA